MRNRFQPGENAWYVNNGKIVCVKILSVIMDPIGEKVDCTFLTGDESRESVLCVATIDQIKLHKFYGQAHTEWKEQK